jgi:hypothetical protein
MIVYSFIPSATDGSTLTPLLRFSPPDRGSVCNVPASIIALSFHAMQIYGPNFFVSRLPHFDNPSPLNRRKHFDMTKWHRFRIQFASVILRECVP